MTATIEDIGIDLPPMDVVKCTCSIGCVFAGPCSKEATIGEEDEELFCDDCREVNKQFREEKAKYDRYNVLLFLKKMYYDRMRAILMGHCHYCDIQCDEEAE